MSLVSKHMTKASHTYHFFQFRGKAYLVKLPEGIDLDGEWTEEEEASLEKEISSQIAQGAHLSNTVYLRRTFCNRRFSKDIDPDINKLVYYAFKQVIGKKMNVVKDVVPILVKTWRSLEAVTKTDILKDIKYMLDKTTEELYNYRVTYGENNYLARVRSLDLSLPCGDLKAKSEWQILLALDEFLNK